MKTNHSWAFFVGTTEETDDYRLVHMEEALKMDESYGQLRICRPAGQPGVKVKIHLGRKSLKYANAQTRRQNSERTLSAEALSSKSVLGVWRAVLVGWLVVNTRQ